MKKQRVSNKKKKKLFVTIFPPIENIHLMKDVGMYPFSMNQHSDYESIVITNSHLDYPYLETEVKGLKKIDAPSIFGNQEYNCILWLLFNAKKVDVLNLFHQVKHSRISIAIYKRINRQGKVYVHLDCDGTEYKHYQLGLEGKGIKKSIKRFIYHNIFYPKWIRKDIIWGVQNKLAEKNIVGEFPYDNVRYMPNGYYSKYKKAVDYSEKENIMLTVGRIGTDQKRTDILLDGFAIAYPQLKGEWKLKVVGPVEQSFNTRIKEFYTKYPELQSRVEFTGPIYDREQLTKEYSKAKIFCLTSDYESFGIVLVEAMAQGCTILTSNFAAAEDLINQGRDGKLFERGSENDFATKLIEIANDERYIEKCCVDCQSFIEDNYTYKHIVEVLNKELQNLD